MFDLLPVHPLLRHPRTGLPLRAVGFVAGRPVWPVMGASPDDGSNNDGAGGTGGGQGNAGSGSGTGSSGTGSGNSDRGYPEGTPLEQMTIEQREAYWKHHARSWESRAKQAPDPQELAQLREKAGKFDEQQQAQMSDLEKATATIAELQEKVRASDLTELRRKAAKDAGLPTDDAEFITATTAEDAKAQAERLKTRLGASTGNGAGGHDQGHRRQQQPSGRDAGLAEAQRRGFVKQTTQT